MDEAGKDVDVALQVPELPVYGVAIPTVSGMRLVLDELGAAQGLRHQCVVAASREYEYMPKGIISFMSWCRGPKGHVVQHARRAGHLHQRQPICCP